MNQKIGHKTWPALLRNTAGLLKSSCVEYGITELPAPPSGSIKKDFLLSPKKRVSVYFKLYCRAQKRTCEYKLSVFVSAARPKPVCTEPSSSPCRRLTTCQCPRAPSSSSSPSSWPQARQDKQTCPSLPTTFLPFYHQSIFVTHY